MITQPNALNFSEEKKYRDFFSYNLFNNMSGDNLSLRFHNFGPKDRVT